MNIDIGQDQNATAARRRGDLADGWAAAHKWLTGDPLPVMDDELTIELHVPRGLDYAGRLAWLEGVAESWGVKTAPDEMAGRKAEKRFGDLLFVACSGHPDRSYSGYMDRAAERRNSVGANGATA